MHVRLAAELVDVLCSGATQVVTVIAAFFAAIYVALHVAAVRRPSIARGVTLAIAGLAGGLFWYAGRGAQCSGDPSMFMLIWSAAVVLHGVATVIFKVARG